MVEYQENVSLLRKLIYNPRHKNTLALGHMWGNTTAHMSFNTNLY